MRVGTAASPPWSRRDALRLATIGMAIVIAYHTVLVAGFTNWDDNRFLTGNPLYQAGGWTYVRAAVSGFQFEAYQPLHLLSYLPDRYLWPDEPAGYHALNLVLFAGDLALLYALLRRHVSDDAAVLACLIVGLHPLCVEPVAWITSRKDLVSLACFLGALLVEDRRDAGSARPSVAGVALGLAAMLAKTSTVCLPLCCAAWLRWVRGASLRVVALRVLPYAIVAAACSAIVWSLWDQHFMIPHDRPLAAPIDVAATLATYLGRMVAPIGLSPAYPAAPPAPAIAAGALAIGVLAIAVTWRRLPSSARFAAAATTAALLPVANLVPVQFRFADRYALLALIMLAFPIAVVIERAIAARPRLTLAIVIALVVAEGTATWRQSAAWIDSRALWSRAVDAQPAAIVGHLKLAETRRDAGDWQGAVAEYQQAIRLDPDATVGYAGLLYAYARRAEADGRLAHGTADAWLRAFERALASEPDFAALYARVAHDACPPCSNLLLGIGLLRWPQPDAALIAAAGRALDARQPDVAMVYLASVRDRTAPGFAAAAARAGAR